MIVRSTTNGVLKSYRYNLQRSTHSLNSARDTVLTGRKFSSYGEDPATAARSFQLRRSLETVGSQSSVSQSVVRKYEIAWSTLGSAVDDSNKALSAIIRAENDPTGSGRNALGQELEQLAKGIVQTMNTKYGDNFVFAGADGLNVPFTWDDAGNLCYRGVNVSTSVPTVETDPNNAAIKVTYAVDPADPTGSTYTPVANGKYYMTTDGEPISITDYEALESDLAALNYMAKEEKKFADIGIGLQETSDGELIETSAYDVALQGITYLGYGTDEDGDPQNIVSIIKRLGELLGKCDEDGNMAEEDRVEFDRLFAKFESSADVLQNKLTELDTEAAFLKSNQTQLETRSYNLQEQIVELEEVDPADAITAYSWAQYCYNSALKVGNSILSESLMDYLNT